MTTPPSLAELIVPELVFPEILGEKSDVLRYFADRIAAHDMVDADPIYLGLLEREELGSTALQPGVAVPHCRTQQAKGVTLSVGVSRAPVAFDAPDGLPVEVFFVLVAPSAQPSLSLQALAAISRFIGEPENTRSLLGGTGRDEMVTILQRDSAVT